MGSLLITFSCTCTPTNSSCLEVSLSIGSIGRDPLHYLEKYLEEGFEGT